MPLTRPNALILALAVLALVLTAVNMFGGFAVTRRMLAMFRASNKRRRPMSAESCHRRLHRRHHPLHPQPGRLVQPRDRTPRQPLRHGRHDHRRAGHGAGPRVTRSGGIPWIIGALVVGGAVGLVAAKKVQMTQMPELVALMHSLVGLAAPGGLRQLRGHLHRVPDRGGEGDPRVEIYRRHPSSARDLLGSIVAFGKLSGKIGGKAAAAAGAALDQPAGACWSSSGFGRVFPQRARHRSGMVPLLVMTVIALLFGVHMVMAIGGADMPVVVSMLNSYSGWAAAATGFMLGNDLLIVTGALVGSSGAILSYIMCRAMNRNFISVIAGGFGGYGRLPPVRQHGAATRPGSEWCRSARPETAEMLRGPERVIVPGYGMAVAQAQHTVFEIASCCAKGRQRALRHPPVAAACRGYMNVLLAKPKVPYDVVLEMDEINDDFPDTDVSMVIGITTSSTRRLGRPASRSPACRCWRCGRRATRSS